MTPIILHRPVPDIRGLAVDSKLQSLREMVNESIVSRLPPLEEEEGELLSSIDDDPV